MRKKELNIHYDIQKFKVNKIYYWNLYFFTEKMHYIDKRDADKRHQ